VGFIAFAGIVILAVIAGFAVQMYDKRSLSYEWLIIALAGAFGAYFFSENVPGATVPLLEGIKDWGPTLDGMYVIPAVIGGVVLAVAAYFGTRASESLQTA
jgi:TctA family transporter